MYNELDDKGIPEEVRMFAKNNLYNKVKKQFGIQDFNFLELEKKLQEAIELCTEFKIEESKEFGFSILVLVFVTQIKRHLIDGGNLLNIEKLLGV